MKIVYSPQAEEFFDKCSPDIRKRILIKMRFFASAPDPLEFAERLTDDREAPYRYRIGKNWRVKFAVENGRIAVISIGRRDAIYRR